MRRSLINQMLGNSIADVVHMDYRTIKGGSKEASRIIMGCMRIDGMEVKEAAALIDKALESGINHFDHADIYGGGRCETLFSKALKECGCRREDMIIQSKCGIVESGYDSSKEHILEAVDGILSRLSMDYLDYLLIHRPDALTEPEEVAEAFDILHSQGKVRQFGVSNYNTGQIKLLQKYVEQPLVINQMQFSITQAAMISHGMETNVLTEGSVNRDGELIDYCRYNDITIQAWSPFQIRFFDGVFIDHPDYPELNRVLDSIAENYGVTKTTIAAAWILRHPAGMQVIAGTTRAERLKEICAAADICLTRKEWYALYRAAGHFIP